MFWPEAWRAFRDMLPPKEQKNIIEGYHSRLFGSSPTEQGRLLELGQLGKMHWLI